MSNSQVRAADVKPGMKMWYSTFREDRQSREIYDWQEVTNVYQSRKPNVTVICFDGVLVPYLSDAAVFVVGESTNDSQR